MAVAVSLEPFRIGMTVLGRRTVVHRGAPLHRAVAIAAVAIPTVTAVAVAALVAPERPIVAVGVAVVPVGAGVVAAGAVGVGEVVPEVDVVPHDVAASPNITIPIRNFLMPESPCVCGSKPSTVPRLYHYLIRADVWNVR